MFSWYLEEYEEFMRQRTIGNQFQMSGTTVKNALGTTSGELYRNTMKILLQDEYEY